MDTFSVRCGKCSAISTQDANDVFSFIATERVKGWEIPDALENKPILCPTCKTPPAAT